MTPAGAALLAALAPISLDELVRRAALLTRVDRKYVLPLPDAEELLAALAGTALILDIDGERHFGYESLYYDTPQLTSYLLAARGRPRRFKVRRRIYLDSGEAYLEVKTRGARGATIKHRRRYPRHIEASAGNRALRGEDRAFVATTLRRNGSDLDPHGALLPALRTAYRRSTLYLPDTDSRVTVDTDLTWSLPGGTQRALPGIAIIETKGAGAKSSADRLLWNRGHRPCRISKYGTGLAALLPDLPANRWAPVMSRYVTRTPAAVLK